MQLIFIILLIKILANIGTHASTEKKDADGYIGFLSLRLDRLHLLSRNKEDISTYIISNPNIAEIKNGILVPKKEGSTEITFYDEHHNKNKTLDVSVSPKLEDTFDQIRQKWKDMLLEERFYNPADSLMSKIQNRTDAEALALWETMNKAEDRKHLWNITKNRNHMTHVTSEFKSLYKLAAAVMNKHSCHYLKRDLLIDTISGLNWMRLNKYNADVHIRITDNSQDWKIGSPSHIVNSLILLYPILTDEEILSYLYAFHRFVPVTLDKSLDAYNCEVRGSNLVSLSKIKILENTLRRNEKGIKDAKEALRNLFPFVTQFDGFYADGSYLQYHNIPSTGSYGLTVLCGVSEILSLFQSTKYAILGEDIDKVFTWINEAYAPLIYNGMFMDMVRASDISIQFDDSTDTAKLFGAIMNIAEVSTKIQVAVYKKMVKQWTTKDSINSLTNYRDIVLAKQILNDSSIGTDGILGTMLKNYVIMERVVYRNVEKGFALGISLSSMGISRYETSHSKNKHGWFTGDGMVYLYNGDLMQFSDNFWATVDPFRLPGITVDSMRVFKFDSSGSWNPFKDFVGGSILDNQTGMIAMDFENCESTVFAHKSWTVFNNKIIALGSGIKYSGRTEAETIFENRKLDKAIQYKLYLNDYEVDISAPFENRVDKVKSIYLESKDINQSIGYKLLTPQKLTIKVENRQGKVLT